MKALCGRCKKLIGTAEAQQCLVCDSPLCKTCSYEFGNCGHPGEDEKIRSARERFARRKAAQ